MRVASERPIVSSVLRNRLDDGQRLEIDATVLYASAEESASQLQLRAERLGLMGGPADGALSVLTQTPDCEVVPTLLARALSSAPVPPQ